MMIPTGELVNCFEEDSMKKSRKRLIAWMLAAVMALTCGSGAAFADEVQTEGEGAAGEAVNVEAEQL